MSRLQNRRTLLCFSTLRKLAFQIEAIQCPWSSLILNHISNLNSIVLYAHYQWTFMQYSLIWKVINMVHYYIFFPHLIQNIYFIIQTFIILTFQNNMFIIHLLWTYLYYCWYITIFLHCILIYKNFIYTFLWYTLCIIENANLNYTLTLTLTF